MSSHRWPAAEPITTERLVLEPLRVEHAEEMAAALDDPGLHTFTGGRPAALPELRARYARQVEGRSPDGRQGWLTWVLRDRETDAPAGYVQATLAADDSLPAGDDPVAAQLAWVVAPAFQGQGLAVESAGAVATWLAGHGVATLVAHVHPRHLASAAVARRLGLSPTDVLVEGETRWRTPPPG